MLFIEKFQIQGFLQFIHYTKFPKFWILGDLKFILKFQKFGISVQLKIYQIPKNFGFQQKNIEIPNFGKLVQIINILKSQILGIFIEILCLTQILIKQCNLYLINYTDVSSIVGTVSNQAADFKTKDRFLNTNTAIYFSYYLQKRVLGGPLVWFKAQFLKNFNLNPHYSFRFKFIIILGDDFDGSFDYDIGGVSDSLTKDSKPTTSTKIGRDRDDKYIIVDRTQSHFTSSFSVQLKCSSNRGNIKDNFCIIYDYFILILECTQYCTACTGPTWAQCTGQQSLPIGMSSPSTQSFYTPAVCRSCTPIYCLECLNSYICTKCATNFYLQNGNCQCYPWTYLTNTNNCVNCHPLCDSCYGSDSTECLFCKSSQHRYLNNNQCVCQSNYYDDGIPTLINNSNLLLF